MFSQDDLLPISALQHLVFCERQAALIHIEGLWNENILTVEGRQLHEHVHEQGTATLHDVRTIRGLRIRSLRLGLVGVTDVVEFSRVPEEDDVICSKQPCNTVALDGESGRWQPEIIEYKRGKPKIDRSDEVQLCAQALCLEEMLGVAIGESSFFYGQPRRRHRVILDDVLREETAQTAARLHGMIRSGKTPPAVYSRKCRSCSLVESCLPKIAEAHANVRKYIENMLEIGEGD